MKCNQCGKVIPETNKHQINYNGKSLILCGKHYSQYVKYGKFLDNSPKSCFDSNEYEITENGVWIYCFNKKQEPSGKFLIDKEDLEKVIAKKWRFWKGNYYTGNKNPISIYRFLINPKSNQVIDHINGKRFDNRKCNLRITTQQKNLLNKNIQSNNNSGVAGVSWDKSRKKWIAEIKMDGIKCYLGRYKNLEDAVFVRYKAELLLFKEFRSTRNDNTILKFVSECKNKENLTEYVKERLQKKYTL